MNSSNTISGKFPRKEIILFFIIIGLVVGFFLYLSPFNNHKDKEENVVAERIILESKINKLVGYQKDLFEKGSKELAAYLPNEVLSLSNNGVFSEAKRIELENLILDCATKNKLSKIQKEMQGISYGRINSQLIEIKCAN